MLERIHLLVFHCKWLVLKWKAIHAEILILLLIHLSKKKILLLVVFILLIMWAIMINHRAYYINLSNISTSFSTWLALFRFFMLIIILNKNWFLFSLTIVLKVLIYKFNFRIFYIVFNITLEIFLIAWTFNLFSFRSHQWYSKWFFLIFQFILIFLCFIIA